MNLKPYPSYKDTGVLWLGAVPAHWSLAAVKRHYDIRLGKMLQNQSEGSKDMEVAYLKAQHVQWFAVQTTNAPRMWASPKDIEQFGIVSGDLLVCEGGEGGRCGIVKAIVDIYIIQNALHRVRPRDYCRNDYLEYVMSAIASSGWFDATNNKATIAHFTSEKFGSLRLPIPSPGEQLAIVRFLGHQDRRIRRYIAAKRKLIALLNEQKQAIINRAVTRGIDPDVRFKPSGVEWLGDVPGHWEVKRLKWVARLQRGYDLPQEQRIPGPYSVVSSGGIIDTHFEAKATGPGVVMGRYGSTDAVFYIESDFWPHNTALFVTDFQGNDPRWCYYLLKTISKADHAGKSAVPGVDRKDLYGIYVPCPPHDEQVRLVSGLEFAQVPVDEAILRVTRELDLIREYRTRLITDVVTGKLDVREAATRLPNQTKEPEEPEMLDDVNTLAEGEVEDDPEQELLTEAQEQP